MASATPQTFQNNSLDWVVVGFDDGEVDVIDLDGKRSVLSSESNSVEGLAWTPDGKELWFAAATRNAGWADTMVCPSWEKRAPKSVPSRWLMSVYFGVSPSRRAIKSVKARTATTAVVAQGKILDKDLAGFGVNFAAASSGSSLAIHSS
jgi:hypothetical protein